MRRSISDVDVERDEATVFSCCLRLSSIRSSRRGNLLFQGLLQVGGGLFAERVVGELFEMIELLGALLERLLVHGDVDGADQILRHHAPIADQRLHQRLRRASTVPAAVCDLVELGALAKDFELIALGDGLHEAAVDQYAGGDLLRRAELDIELEERGEEVAEERLGMREQALDALGGLLERGILREELLEDIAVVPVANDGVQLSHTYSAKRTTTSAAPALRSESHRASRCLSPAPRPLRASLRCDGGCA